MNSSTWITRASQLTSGIAKGASEISRIAPTAVGHTRYTAPLDTLKLVSALDQFQECVRYLNTRRSSGAVINISSENDVQDVVYLMLRPWITDIVYENPTDRFGSRYVIKDFLTKELKTVVEAKYVRDKKHGKGISKELHDDIESYKTHPDAQNIIFFIYDPNALIPDATALRRHIDGTRKYGEKTISVYCIVKP